MQSTKRKFDLATHHRIGWYARIMVGSNNTNPFTCKKPLVESNVWLTLSQWLVILFEFYSSASVIFQLVWCCRWIFKSASWNCTVIMVVPQDVFIKILITFMMNYVMPVYKNKEKTTTIVTDAQRPHHSRLATGLYSV